MSEASLERGYRRLLACYPRGFRAEQEDEMLAVLMASAGDDQRRPGLLDTLDVLRSAVVMRLRSLRSGPETRGWADGLALFSVLAPLFLVLSSLLELVWPLRVPLLVVHKLTAPPLRFVAHQQIGWQPLLHMSGFWIALAGQVVVAALALLGLRRLALLAIAGSVAYWIAARYWIPYPLQLLTTGGYLLEAAALTVSPGRRPGRHLVNWGHGVVLVLAAGAVQVSTLWVHRPSFFVFAGPHTQISIPLLITAAALAAAALGTAAALRMNRYLLLLAAVTLYPYVLQLVYNGNRSGYDLIVHPTPLSLAALYGPPLLLAAGAIVFAGWRRWSGAEQSADAAKPA